MTNVTILITSVDRQMDYVSVSVCSFIMCIYRKINICDWIWKHCLSCTQHQGTFSPSNNSCIISTNNSGRYWWWNLPRLLLLWLISEAGQTTMSAWVTFKWLYIPLTGWQPTVIHHMTSQSLAMDLAALCGM